MRWFKSRLDGVTSVTSSYLLCYDEKRSRYTIIQESPLGWIMSNKFAIDNWVMRGILTEFTPSLLETEILKGKVGL